MTGLAKAILLHMDHPAGNSESESHHGRHEGMPETELVALARCIGDLGVLIDELLKGLTQAKPWQRQLALTLGDADRQLQVMRMAVSMQRPAGEIEVAAKSVRMACARANSTALMGRADVTTKAAVRLVSALAGNVEAAVRTASSFSSEQPTVV